MTKKICLALALLGSLLIPPTSAFTAATNDSPVISSEARESNEMQRHEEAPKNNSIEVEKREISNETDFDLAPDILRADKDPTGAIDPPG